MRGVSCVDWGEVEVARGSLVSISLDVEREIAALEIALSLGLDESRVAFGCNAGNEAVQLVMEHVAESAGCRAVGAASNLLVAVPNRRRNEELASDTVRWCRLPAYSKLLAEPVERLEALDGPDDDNLSRDCLAVAHTLDKVEELRHQCGDAASTCNQDARIECSEISSHAAVRSIKEGTPP
ncbi:hypothetical protein HYQ46_009292 [Verticillium longisporum]|nr:hypothetical protein HYQ46_009292 [Verticillium longisporum]